MAALKRTVLFCLLVLVCVALSAATPTKPRKQAREDGEAGTVKPDISNMKGSMDKIMEMAEKGMPRFEMKPKNKIIIIK